MSAISDRPEPALAVDLRVDCSVVLPQAVAREAEAAASVLVRLTLHLFGNPAWQAWHARFLDRYGSGAVVPVGQVVDAGTGLGYPAGLIPASAAPLRSPPHPEHAPGGGSVWVRSGVTAGASPEPLWPGCPPGLRSFERSRDERSARRAAFAPIESFEGGVEEFVEFIPNRRRNSAFSASKVSTRATNPTISAASSSYDGCGGSGADTTQMIDDQSPTTDPDTPSPILDVPSHQDQLSTDGPAQPDP